MTEHITSHAAPHETDTGNAPREKISMPDNREANVDTQLLYPSVGRVMEDLKRIIDENTEAIDIKRTASGEPILTPGIISAWEKEVGFGNERHGTLHNADTYVYFKDCNLISKEEEIDETLATARHLTSLGALHPESQWGVLESGRSDYPYRLFVVSPKLEAWSLDEELEGTYEDRQARPTHDLSYLVDWYKRIDPNFVPGQPIPEDSLLHHLNWTEASSFENWGWDETGALFPVDVEVLHPSDSGSKTPEPWRPVDIFDDTDDLHL